MTDASTPRPTVHHGDCLAELRTLPDESVHAVVTDPPYGLSNTDPKHVAETLTKWVTGDHEYTPPVKGGGFMGKTWDSFVPPPAVWNECMRVLKPGGHLLVFAGTRTQDLMGLSIRLAGFELRDSLAWIYGSGFPKSMDVSKAIDKSAGAQREVIGNYEVTRDLSGGSWADLHGKPNGAVLHDITAPATPEAQQWAGWGTALKPAIEPVIVARKPIKGTVAANVLEHGTGGINVDGCRVPTTDNLNGGAYAKVGGRTESASLHAGSGMNVPGKTTGKNFEQPEGRFPPNVLLDPDAAAAMDEQSGWQRDGIAVQRNGGGQAIFGGIGEGENKVGAHKDQTYGSGGGASRFFPVFKYQAKAPAKERPSHTAEDGTEVKHPTVKPLELMRWLVRLVTPPGGVVLDPFAGSGTTGEAAMLEGFDSILIEGEAEYLPLIDVRIERSADETPTPAPGPTPPTLYDRIRRTTTQAELAALYDEVTATDPTAWTDEHTAAGFAHLERNTTP